MTSSAACSERRGGGVYGQSPPPPPGAKSTLPESHLLQRAAAGQGHHQVGDGLQEAVEGVGEGVGRLPGDHDVRQGVLAHPEVSLLRCGKENDVS